MTMGSPGPEVCSGRAGIPGRPLSLEPPFAHHSPSGDGPPWRERRRLIKVLRKRTQGKMALKDFHDVVLRSGPLPLDILEREVMEAGK